MSQTELELFVQQLRNVLQSLCRCDITVTVQGAQVNLANTQVAIQVAKIERKKAKKCQWVIRVWDTHTANRFRLLAHALPWSWRRRFVFTFVKTAEAKTDDSAHMLTLIRFLLGVPLRVALSSTEVLENEVQQFSRSRLSQKDQVSWVASPGGRWSDYVNCSR